MLLRRVIDHVRTQNWTAVALDFVIVVVGVFIGIQVANWNEARQSRQRLDRIVMALKVDMADARRVEAGFLDEIEGALTAFEAAYAGGERPPPFVFRIKGSDTAPNLIWGTLQQAGLAELIDPQLLFELSHFYSERDGIGVKITRYMQSVETDIAPYLGGDAAVFYDDGGAEMRAEFRASMARLREWSGYLKALGPWSECLERRLETASRPGETCRYSYFSDYGDAAPAPEEAD
ncbi:MAG: hypothetical protein AAFX08_08005 [Pseudomonadota bacterium]